jgi:hypothetical protein
MIPIILNPLKIDTTRAKILYEYFYNMLLLTKASSIKEKYDNFINSLAINNLASR